MPVTSPAPSRYSDSTVDAIRLAIRTIIIQSGIGQTPVNAFRSDTAEVKRVEIVPGISALNVITGPDSCRVHDDEIAIRTAIDRIDAISAIQGVVALSADQRVFVVASVKDVVIDATVKKVSPRAAKQSIVIVTSDKCAIAKNAENAVTVILGLNVHCID